MKPLGGVAIRTVPVSGDQQPVLRARQRHIQQPPVFFMRFGFRNQPRPRRRLDIAILARRPDQRSVHGQDGIARQFRFRGCIRQDHDRRLQPLRPVHRHDPDFRTRLRQVALDLHGSRLKRRHEQLKRRRPGRIMRQCARQQGLDRIARRRAEPCIQLRPTRKPCCIRLVQHCREKLERRQPGPVGQRLKEAANLDHVQVLARQNA